MLYTTDVVELPEGVTRRGSRNAHVRVGVVDATVTVEEMRPIDGPPLRFDGWLGMDMLRGCVIALDGSRFAAGCRRGRTASVMRGPDIEQQRWVSSSRSGPKLRMRVNGSYDCDGAGVHASVARDGVVTFEGRRVAWMRQRRLDDDRTDKRWFLDETFEMRAALARDEERRNAESSLDGLVGMLDGIWRDNRLPAPVRRRILFTLWDDCIEPDDPSLGWAGRRARLIINNYVRHLLPDGSADAFTPGEVARLNQTRVRPPYFAPYSGDDDIADVPRAANRP